MLVSSVAISNVPWLTPDTIPEDDDCRPLFIPASSEWLALVSGALTELTQPYNWQQQGAVTVAQAVAVMQVMVNAYYGGCAPCVACTTPGGYHILRLNPDSGHVEELADDGTWQTPSGDYAISPVPARMDSDPICLAAANCVNVLQQIYENITDSFSSELSTAEAYIALATFLASLIAPEFAPITFAIGAFFLAVFAAVYATVEFLTADLWDTNFTKALTCILIDCATNDAGVVTFDYQCVEKALYAQINIFDLTETQLRLYGQVSFLISSIGGADGLNLAGATTAITEYDCSFCDDTWCYQWDTNADLLSEGAVQDFATDVSNFWHLDTSAFTLVRAEFPYCMGGGGGSAVAMWPTPDFSDVWALYSGLTAGCYDFDSDPLAVEPVSVTTGIAWGCNSGGDVVPPASSDGLKIHGRGTMPAFTSGHTC